MLTSPCEGHEHTVGDQELNGKENESPVA
jgi:hypothetical protein